MDNIGELVSDALADFRKVAALADDGLMLSLLESFLHVGWRTVFGAEESGSKYVEG